MSEEGQAPHLTVAGLIHSKGYTSFDRAFLPIVGMNAAIFLGMLKGWASVADQDGWLYHSTATIEEETGLSPDQQRRVKKGLLDRGWIEERKRKDNSWDHVREFRLVWQKIDDEVADHYGLAKPDIVGEVFQPTDAAKPDTDGGVLLPTYRNQEPHQEPNSKNHTLSREDALLSESVSGGEGSQGELTLPGVPTVLEAVMEGVGLHMGNPDAEAAHKRGLQRGSTEQRKVRESKRQTEAERRRWFDAWLSVYPRPELAEDAWREFRTLGSQITPDLMDAMTAGLEAWIRSEQWQKEDGRFIPGAAKFIRNRLWGNPPRPARHVMELPDA